MKSKERQLKAKEAAMRKQEMELGEQNGQMCALKSLVDKLEQKINHLEEENRLLRTKLNATIPLAQERSKPQNETADINNILTNLISKQILNQQNNCQCQNTSHEPKWSYQLHELQQSVDYLKRQSKRLQYAHQQPYQYTNTWPNRPEIFEYHHRARKQNKTSEIQKPVPQEIFEYNHQRQECSNEGRCMQNKTHQDQMAYPPSREEHITRMDKMAISNEQHQEPTFPKTHEKTLIQVLSEGDTASQPILIEDNETTNASEQSELKEKTPKKNTKQSQNKSPANLPKISPLGNEGKKPLIGTPKRQHTQQQSFLEINPKLRKPPFLFLNQKSTE